MFIARHEVIRLASDRTFNDPIIVRIILDDGQRLRHAHTSTHLCDVDPGTRYPLFGPAKLVSEYAADLIEDRVANHGLEFPLARKFQDL